MFDLMEPLFYSTGQAARQLRTTLPVIRALCENGVITAETTPGGHWRLPASVVERLKRDGLPPIPRPLPTEGAEPERSGPAGRRVPPEPVAEPSEEVVSAAEQVDITRSMLEKRKIERELEENEDWFRERQRRQASAEAAERQRTEAKEAELRHLQCKQQWTQYALNSMPYDARREVEMEVHTAVQEALSALQPNQPQAVTQRLVDAAVHKALRPWTRKQEIERALKTAMNRLPWDVQCRAEYAPLKQMAWEAAVAAIRRVRDEAPYREIETAAVEAVQPMIREHEHQQVCQRIVGRLYIYDASSEEEEAAKEAVRKALAEFPIGAGQRQLEKAEEVAIAPFKAAVAARKEKARLESERQARRRALAWKADLHLDHIARHLEQEYEFDGGYAEVRREADRLRPLIREALIDELVENPNMSGDNIRESIEDQIDDGL
jgi:excisionase family DNA binding protein